MSRACNHVKIFCLVHIYHILCSKFRTFITLRCELFFISIFCEYYFIISINNRGKEHANLSCPICDSENKWKDGKRKIKSGFVQRYTCKECETRYSGEKIINDVGTNRIHQIGDILTESKNLIVASKSWATGDNENCSGIINDYVLCLERIPLAEDTVTRYARALI